MNRRKPLGILTLLAVMLLSMAVFLSTSLADGKTSDDDPTPATLCNADRSALHRDENAHA